MAIILVRTFIIYFALVAAMRLLGKRQLGELELSELVVAVLVADIAVNPLQDIGMPLIYGLAPLLVLFCCEILVSGLALKSLRLRRLLYGLPSMIIEKGKIAQREMQKNRFTPDELAQELRIQGIMDISSVEYAILETNGQLNIILYPAEQPVTAKQMQVDVPDGGFFSIVISDGRVLTDNLTRLGLDRRWLEKELRRRGADGPKRVYLMMVNDDGEIYYAAKEQRA